MGLQRILLMCLSIPFLIIPGIPTITHIVVVLRCHIFSISISRWLYLLILLFDGYIIICWHWYLNYEDESKSNAFFFRTGMITNTGTCIIHQNEAGPLWITSLLLNVVTISLNSNIPPSNESMYTCLVKFCWLFFEPTLSLQFSFPHHWNNVFLL